MILILYRKLSEKLADSQNESLRFIKEALESYNLPYEDISYADLPVNLSEFLSRFSLVFVRNVGNASETLAKVVNVANSLSIPVVDTRYSINLKPLSKQQQFELLSEVVNVPATTFYSRLKDIHIRPEQYPFVLKMNRGGRQGDGTYLIKSEADFVAASEDIMQKPNQDRFGVLVQQYIENDGDYRVVSVAGNVSGIFKRGSKKPNLKMNSSEGKSTITYIPYEISEMTKAVHGATLIDFASMDYVFCKKTLTYYLIEVNESPMFNNMNKRIKGNVAKSLAAFLKSKIKNGE